MVRSAASVCWPASHEVMTHAILLRPPPLCINEEKLEMLPFLLWEEVYTLHCTSESLNGM